MATDSRRLASLGRLRWAAWLWFAIAGTAVAPLMAQSRHEPFAEYDLAMFDRPKLEYGPAGEITFADGLTDLWRRALDRPDAELQRLVIDTLAMAHRRGVEGVDELKPKLVEMASSPEQSLDVLRSLVRTLIEYGAKEQAGLLAELAKRHGAPIGQIVEPAIAEWRSPLLEEEWLQRISGPPSGTVMTVLAIRGLAAIESERAVEPLRAIARDLGERSQLRMAAAESLGRLSDPQRSNRADGLREDAMLELAEELMSQNSAPASLHPILATQLLATQTGTSSVAFLTRLLDHDSTTVQSEALEQLYRIDFRLIDPHREKLLVSRDVNVRRWCLRALVDLNQADRIELICRLLDDVNPTLRRDAAASLIELARDQGKRDVVIDETTKVLAQTSWRGCEQACVVLTRLDHKPSGPRMVELLGHERGEVRVASAWGLSKLRIEALLPDMLDHAESVYEGFRSGVLHDGMPGYSLQMAHLFIAFGDQNYRAADSLMRAYLPKDHSLGMKSRPAAAWALGMLHEGDPEPELTKALLQRLLDTGLYPETEEMRDMSAIALGRMEAESAIPELRKFASQGMRSCAWSLEKLTGETIPFPKPEKRSGDDWFLTPVSETGQ